MLAVLLFKIGLLSGRVMRVCNSSSCRWRLETEWEPALAVQLLPPTTLIGSPCWPHLICKLTSGYLVEAMYLFTIIFVCILVWDMCIGVGGGDAASCTMARVWRSEDDFVELVLSSFNFYVSSRDWTQANRHLPEALSFPKVLVRF